MRMAVLTVLWKSSDKHIFFSKLNFEISIEPQNASQLNFE